MCMSIKDFMSKEQLENRTQNDVILDNTGGMTRYTRNIDDKYKNCKIADSKQEIIKEGDEHIGRVLTVKELIEVLSAIDNKNLEVYVRGNTWMMVPCNQVIECSGDGDCLLLASHMEFDKVKAVNDLTDHIKRKERNGT